MEQLSFDDAADSGSHPLPGAKLCECGCGNPAPISKRDYPDLGYMKGEPTRFIKGHFRRGKPGKSGAESHNWTGDAASYQAIHQYLLKYYPKTGVCEECGKRSKRTEHALIHGRHYSRNREDYRELCPGCHHQYDQAGKPKSPALVAKMREGQKRRWEREREQGIRRRLPTGEQVAASKLTDAKVAEILVRFRDGETSITLSRDYDVSKRTILEIVHRRIWKHVLPDLAPLEITRKGPARKATDEQIRALYERHLCGEMIKDLAAEVGFLPNTLSGKFRPLKSRAREG